MRLFPETAARVLKLPPPRSPRCSQDHQPSGALLMSLIELWGAPAGLLAPQIPRISANLTPSVTTTRLIFEFLILERGSEYSVPPSMARPLRDRNHLRSMPNTGGT